MSKWEEELEQKLEQDLAKFNKHKKKICIIFMILCIICLLLFMFVFFMFYIFPRIIHVYISIWSTLEGICMW